MIQVKASSSNYSDPITAPDARDAVDAAVDAAEAEEPNDIIWPPPIDWEPYKYIGGALISFISALGLIIKTASASGKPKPKLDETIGAFTMSVEIFNRQAKELTKSRNESELVYTMNIMTESIKINLEEVEEVIVDLEEDIPTILDDTISSKIETEFGRVKLDMNQIREAIARVDGFTKKFQRENTILGTIINAYRDLNFEINEFLKSLSEELSQEKIKDQLDKIKSEKTKAVKQITSACAQLDELDAKIRREKLPIELMTYGTIIVAIAAGIICSILFMRTF